MYQVSTIKPSCGSPYWSCYGPLLDHHWTWPHSLFSSHQSYNLITPFPFRDFWLHLIFSVEYLVVTNMSEDPYMYLSMSFIYFFLLIPFLSHKSYVVTLVSPREYVLLFNWVQSKGVKLSVMQVKKKARGGV